MEHTAKNRFSQKVEKTSNAFKIILPNLAAETTEPEKKTVRSNEENKIIQLAAKNGSITRMDAEKALGVSGSTASRLLRKMVQQGLRLQTGSARNTKYILS